MAQNDRSDVEVGQAALKSLNSLNLENVRNLMVAKREALSIASDMHESDILRISKSKT